MICVLRLYLKYYYNKLSAKNCVLFFASFRVITSVLRKIVNHYFVDCIYTFRNIILNLYLDRKWKYQFLLLFSFLLILLTSPSQRVFQKDVIYYYYDLFIESLCLWRSKKMGYITMTINASQPEMVLREWAVSPLPVVISSIIFQPPWNFGFYLFFVLTLGHPICSYGLHKKYRYKDMTWNISTE